MMLMSATYYVAVTAPLMNSAVISDTVLFVPKWNDMDIAPNDVVCFVGGAMSLENSINSVNGGGGNDCTAANGCGVHIHAGTDCTDKEAQGGHWYNNENLSVDPWKLVGYKDTNSTGYGKYATCVHTGFDVTSNPDQLVGHSFIVHAEDGSRVSCGLISKAPKDFEPAYTVEADTIPIPGTESSASGHVLVTTPSPLIPDALCYMGYAKGLENEVKSYLLGGESDQCNVANGCGAHIHEGAGCADKTEQGGHYYNEEEILEDPWKTESYYETSASGEAALIGCAITGHGGSGIESTAYDYPFIIHKTDGSRLLCGVLEDHSDNSSASGSAFGSMIIAFASIIVGVIIIN